MRQILGDRHQAALSRRPGIDARTCPTWSGLYVTLVSTMARQRTAFDEFFTERMSNPEVASAYAEARAEVDQVDQFMRALEAARAASGLSKAELARQIKMPAAGVRRVLSSEDANPTIATVLGILRTMGLGLQIVPTAKAGKGKARRGLLGRKQGTARTKAKGRAGQSPSLSRR
jgi:DNA-binding phage protein